MSDNHPARTRRTLSTVLAALVAALAVSATLVGVLVLRPQESSSSSGASPAVDTAVTDTPAVTPDAPSAATDRHLRPPRPAGGPHGAGDDRDVADGAVPDGVTVFDDEYPGVANLDSELLRALREAATDAADDGVTFYVNSGWRSPEYQDQLLREAISEYGSEEEAARWVSSADTSLHVSGDAVDIGPSDATAWLSEHGAEYGLCQIYGNEPWHYELRRQAVDDDCPAMYADPTRDPRMQ
ncbi:M15 family metallopeptidase [Jiangella gansuensis]|uniref:M15 family metallopeptidase n=1 Tax=Jiangella gansuensis TaxID=281473 RepID=UPI0004B5BA7D